MKVAVLGLFPSDPTRIVGGVEAITLRLCEGLSRMPGVDVDVLVSTPDRQIESRRLAPNWIVHSIGTFDHLGNVLLALPDRRRMVQALHRIKPDIVHAHSTDRHALAALDSGLPTVVSIHGVIEKETRLEKSPLERLRGVFRDHMAANALRRSQNIIYSSPYLRDLYDAKLTRTRRWIVENPVGNCFFNARAKEASRRVLYSGLLIPRKGIRNLLAATALARKEVPDIELVLAGAQTDDSYRDAVRTRADAPDLRGCVTLLGGLSPERLADECAQAAFVVLVSRQDTSPVSIQEAMAAGKPVIGSDVGGIPYLVREGKTGFLVPYGEPALLARRMAELLRDADLRRRMGDAARREALKRFSIESVARTTLDVYHDILCAPR